MATKFHTELVTYVKNNDNQNATRVILNELAIALVKDKENFIEVLRNAGINVMDGASDLELIDAFVKNAPRNKKLLLGASLLVNHRNQTINFDGESSISDAGVKTAYSQLDDYFNAEGYSNAGWMDAIKGIADVGGQVTGKVMDAQADKKRGASIALAKQQEARKQMMQSLMQQKQAEVDKKNAETRKRKRIMLIAGASILGLALIVGAVVLLKKNKK